MLVRIQLAPMFGVSQQSINHFLATNFLVEPGLIAGPTPILTRHAAHRKIINRIPRADAGTSEILRAKMLIDIKLHPGLDHAAKNQGIEPRQKHCAQTDVPEERRSLPIARRERDVSRTRG